MKTNIIYSLKIIFYFTLFLKNIFQEHWLKLFLKTDNFFKITWPTMTQYFCKWVFIKSHL